MQVMYNGSWTDVTPSELNEWLDGRGYDGTPVRLISCGAGSDTSKIAQEAVYYAAQYADPNLKTIENGVSA